VPIEHIRNLAKYGILTDPDPYDLAPEAWSGGVNVRFRNGKVTGGPVFRSALVLGNTDPRFTCSANPSTGLDLLFVGYKDGTVSRVQNGAEVDYSVSGFTPSAAEATWTSTTLANVTYINRSDRAPWYLRASDAQFQNLGVFSGGLSGAWDSTWSCQILRACGGALVALNVTEGATNSPTMVKTSSIPLAGMIPASWDITTSSTLATENILAEMQGPITDACKLGTSLCIYGNAEAWAMTPNGALSIYNYDKLPFKKGSINANCSVEIDGKNFVFGPDDIWMHDGTSEKSLCDEKVREFIYGSINLSKSSRCFVNHNPRLKEITFAYVSGDRLVSFLNNPDGCNRQAVYNYSDGTWTFDDLPMCFSACMATLSNQLTYATVTATYATIGGSYLDQEDGYKRVPVYVGSSNSTYSLSTSLYAFDLYGQGSMVSFGVDTHATMPRYLERDGIDLDEINVDLRGYKTISSIYPQARLGSGASNLMINAGASDGFNQPATFVGWQPYNGNDLYKLDFNVAGRYLSLQIKFSDYKELSVSGFDLDMKVTGQA